MTKLIGISGSLRKGSLNSALLRAATGLMPEGAELEIGTIRGIRSMTAMSKPKAAFPKPSPC